MQMPSRLHVHKISAPPNRAIILSAVNTIRPTYPTARDMKAHVSVAHTEQLIAIVFFANGHESAAYQGSHDL